MIFAPKVKMFFWIVSIIGIIVTSLLAVLAASLSDFQKGVISGILLASYVWLAILMFLNCFSEVCSKTNLKISELFEGLIGCLVKNIVELEVDEQ